MSQLARSSGVEIGLARKWVAARLIHTSETGGFRASDITKMRLLRALLEAGFDADQLKSAAEQGTVSLDYIDLLMPEPIPLVDVPEDEPSMADEESQDIIRLMLGSGVEENIIREDDLALLRLVARGRELGAPIEHIVRTVRATALSTQHIVELQREFVDEVLLGPAIERTGSPTVALAETAETRYEFRELGRQLIFLLLERFANDAVFRNIVELTEMGLRRGHVRSSHDEQAVAFIDVSDYMRLSREAGDAIAAEQATLLTDIAQGSARLHGGRLVKSLGDGALAHFADSTGALWFALDMVGNAERRGLWALHAGVNAGPMLRRDGDYFGTAVNVASRVANTAEPGQVVVTRRVVEAWPDKSVTFETLGKVQVKNVDEPVEMFIAKPVRTSTRTEDGPVFPWDEKRPHSKRVA